jgi:peptidoglycan/LPS O-acetylase OafA/YrhL
MKLAVIVIMALVGVWTAIISALVIFLVPGGTGTWDLGLGALMLAGIACMVPAVRHFAFRKVAAAPKPSAKAADGK